MNSSRKDDEKGGEEKKNETHTNDFFNCEVFFLGLGSAAAFRAERAAAHRRRADGRWQQSGAGGGSGPVGLPPELGGSQQTARAASWAQTPRHAARATGSADSRDLKHLGGPKQGRKRNPLSPHGLRQPFAGV